ncbi:hypothetical protein NCCP2716_29180 [Sporosarcina sp. NCCP-2716]|nr:hypothetical protein NCCP2716_29180 [Sporosarcina sp. NCCP-2716]
MTSPFANCEKIAVFFQSHGLFKISDPSYKLAKVENIKINIRIRIYINLIAMHSFYFIFVITLQLNHKVI